MKTSVTLSKQGLSPSFGLFPHYGRPQLRDVNNMFLRKMADNTDSICAFWSKYVNKLWLSPYESDVDYFTSKDPVCDPCDFCASSMAFFPVGVWTATPS